MPIKRFATYFAVSTAAAAATAMLTVAPANAADKWAAIAFSPVNGSYGWVTDADSAPIARNVALQSCTNQGGAECEVVAEMQNGCVALAESPTHYAGGTGGNLLGAERNALVELGTGTTRITFSTCSV